MGIVVGYGSLGLLALVGLALAFPSTSPTVNATTVECGPGEEPCTTALAETGVDLLVASTVSVAMQNRVELEITPKANGNFTSSSTELSVATNNPSGYAIYMQAGKVTQDKSSLISTDLGNTAVIEPVTGIVESAEFTSNTWGYSLDGKYYQAVPTTASLVKDTDTTTFKDTYNLSFGVAVNTQLPAGQYTNSVIVSAVANPIQITSLNQLVYMQDMTSDICTNTAEHTTKQLIDTRDGKTYWVAKLKDGNCWMTQNLALDLSTDKALTPSDSDVKTTWTPASSTNSLPITGENGDKSNSAQYSWNIGKIALALPLAGIGCTINSIADIAQTCRDAGLVDVSGAEWQPTYAVQTGEYNGKSEVMVAVDEKNKTYDAHYLIGNYYQYNVATAGVGLQTSDANGVADSSICPKNWKLALSGRDDNYRPIVNPNSSKGSIYQLLTAYGYPAASDYFLDSSTPTGPSGAFTVILNRFENTVGNLVSAPLYFVHTGAVYAETPNIRGVGTGTFYLTDTAWSVSRSLWIYINATYVTPAFAVDRYMGGPVRCLAR